MSFFNSYTTEPVTGEFEMGGGNFEPLPEGTKVAAFPDEVKLDSYDGDPEYVSIRWSVMSPAEYKDRKIFQKIQINSPDDKKKDKAMRMLLAIDANAGGRILAANQYPDEALLSTSLMLKPQILRLGVWEQNDKKGNWVQAVAPYKRGQSVDAPKPTTPSSDINFSDDVPF